jgi:hypothetical protein
MRIDIDSNRFNHRSVEGNLHVQIASMDVEPPNRTFETVPVSRDPNGRGADYTPGDLRKPRLLDCG